MITYGKACKINKYTKFLATKQLKNITSGDPESIKVYNRSVDLLKFIHYSGALNLYSIHGFRDSVSVCKLHACY